MIDATDRITVVGACAACAIDSFLYLQRWQIIVVFLFGALALFFWCLSLSLKGKMVKGAAPSLQKDSLMSDALDPENLHSWMHACAGVAVFVAIV